MSIPYNTPIVNSAISDSLLLNPALNPSLGGNQNVLNEVTNLLGLDVPDNETVIGNIFWNGASTAISVPGEDAPTMLVVESDAGQTVTITSDLVGPYSNTVKFYSFDGDGEDGNVEMIVAVGDPVILSGGGDDLFNLSQSDAVITVLAGGGNDSVLTGSQDDYISGDAGNDFIIANLGNDSIYAGTTDVLEADFDTIDGGSGWDTVYLPGYASELDAPQIINEWVSFDNHTTADWGALVENVEFIDLWEEGSIDNFDPLTHTVTGEGLQNSIVVVDNETDLLIGRMYQATLNRSADSEGVQWWFDNETDLVDTAQGFISSDEFISDWGDDLTTAEFINQIYVNAFHREADLEGSIFWWQAIEDGVITRAEFVVEIVGSDEADATINNVVQVTNII